MRITFSFLFCLAFSLSLFGQDSAYNTFKDTRVINAQSVEVLPKGRLDVRISHRFGDLAGDNGGFATFFGLESASDISIGADYGVSKRLTIGLHRSKGAGVSSEGFSGLRQLMNASFKYNFATQSDDTPLSATIYGLSSMSTQKKLESAGSDLLIASFPEFSHRFAFHASLILARKISDNFSLQVSPAYTHRNLVPFEDKNGMFSVAAATRVQMTKNLSLVADATFPLIESRTTDLGYYPALGIGLEVETGGHVFQINVTNATALMETDYIPYTTSNWADGQFRLGFTISRWFNL